MTALVRLLWARPVLLLWVPPALWATNIVIARALAGIVAPVQFNTLRWAIAFFALLPFVWQRALRQWPLLRAHWRLMVIAGALGMAGHGSFAYLALQSAPAATVAFLNSTLPLMVPVAAWALAREPTAPRTLAGIAISFVGVGWIVTRGDLEALATLSIGTGELLTLAALAAYATYSVLIRRKPPALDLFVFLLATMGGGVLVSLPFCVLEFALGGRVPFDLTVIGAAVHIGLLVSLLAYVIWNRCVIVLGPTITGASFHLVAMFAPLLAWFALGEALQGFHLAGIALILAGFALAVSPARARVD